MFSRLFCRKDQKEAQPLEKRVIVVPPDVMKDPAFRKQILQAQLRACKRYLVIAGLCELASAIVNWFHGHSLWSVEIGSVHIKDAPPGITLAILGVVIVGYTVFRLVSKRSPDNPPTPPTPPTPPPTPDNGWLICRWLRRIFQRRYMDRSRHLSWGMRGIELPDDCTDPDFWKEAAQCESEYSDWGSILGAFVIVLGVIEAIVGCFDPTHWDATFFFVTIRDASPAILHMIIGVTIILLTQFDVKIGSNDAKQKTDGEPKSDGQPKSDDTTGK
jgi:hypothetical protein